jgi:cytoskeletal protein RodZ
LQEPLTGAVLRQLREQLGADIDDICDLTKINRRYVIALEEEDFSQLPATVYVRGFVGEYARVLGLEAQATAPYIEAYTKWHRARL